MKPRIEQAHAVLIALSTPRSEQPADKEMEHVLSARLTLDVLLAIDGLLESAIIDCGRLGDAPEAERKGGAS
jgi:hypothetical protein